MTTNEGSIKYIIGIDEAGRGPLAGPLAVGAVIIPASSEITHPYFEKGIRDSKKLTEKRREEILQWMREHNDIKDCVAFAPSVLIDSIGVTASIQKLIDGVIGKLIPEGVADNEIQIVLDGGLKAPERFTHQQTIIKGDEKEVVIALASVAAKVTRDMRMLAIAEKYPQYGFEKHKGYGTKAHFKALKEYGMCPEHRRRFVHM